MTFHSRSIRAVALLFALAISTSNRTDAAEAAPPLAAPEIVPPPAPVPPPNPIPPPSYGSIAAGQEAYQRGRQERLDAIGRQLGTIDRMAWLSGQVTLYPYPSLSAVYAYGGHRPYRGAIAVPAAPRYGYPPATFRVSVFEPWPLVPGDIYGYPHLDRVPQPIGHEVITTGPGGSIYRPVYPSPAAPLAASATPRSQPAATPVPTAPPPAIVPTAPADKPPSVGPEPILTPPPVASGPSGPREF